VEARDKAEVRRPFDLEAPDDGQYDEDDRDPRSERRFDGPSGHLSERLSLQPRVQSTKLANVSHDVRIPKFTYVDTTNRQLYTSGRTS
jgi:hypothetical protein